MEQFDKLKFNGRNVIIGENVKIGTNVKIGDNTTIYDNVIIGNNTIICNDCIIGEPLNSYYYDANYINPILEIGHDSLIRSHNIIYAGSKLDHHLNTGHRVTIREKTEVGFHCQFGSYNDIQGLCKIGNHVRCQSFVNIGQFSDIGNYVFLYPYVILTNDPTPPSLTELGVMIDDYSVVTCATVMLPGSRLGKFCLVSANSTVGGEFEDHSFIGGNPAKKIMDLRKAPLFNKATGKRHYPWPNNFSRNMPWDGIGFDNWEKMQ